MNKKLQLLFVCFFFVGLQTIFSQQIENKPQKPYQITKPSKVERVPSLASRMGSLPRPGMTKISEMQDGRSA
ncbi:MAG: hypothetical protein JKY02_02575 [Flavobacteriaceae bacterium]|nr:hypothetical protein [Flavobacteriaceae bacterium]